MMTETVLVVPCFNEASRLHADRYARFVQDVQGVQILFVNDGSSDSTAEVLADLCRRNPSRLKYLDLPSNCGKAEAVRRGIHAAARFNPDYVGFWDADLATPLEALLRFREVLATHPNVQTVIGSRIRMLGHRIARRRLRRWLGAGFGSVASQVLGVPVRDPQCGAKLFRADTDLYRLFERPFRSRWIFDVEVIARALAGAENRRLTAGQRIYELPLDEWSEVAGSKLRARDFARAVWDLAVIAVEYRLPRRKRSNPQYNPAPSSTLAAELAHEPASAESQLPVPRLSPTKAA